MKTVFNRLKYKNVTYRIVIVCTLNVKFLVARAPYWIDSLRSAICAGMHVRRTLVCNCNTRKVTILFNISVHISRKKFVGELKRRQSLEEHPLQTSVSALILTL